MYHTKAKSSINYRELISNIDQADAFAWYLNTDVSSYFRNPFRVDTEPGCYLEWSNDLLLMWDWGDVNYKGKSILQVIAYSKNLTYNQAAEFLYYNYVLEKKDNNISSKSINIKRSKNNFNKVIIPTARQWNVEDKDYWSKYFITKKNLEFENVIPILWYYTNSANSPQDYFPINPTESTYGIPIKNRWKIYTPSIKKFDTNQRWDDIGGLEPFNNEDDILVTKSFKDYRVLATQGYNTRYILCETVRINPDFVKYISKDFNKVYYLMDNDVEGIKACERFVLESKELTNLDIYKGITFPLHLPKDASDIIKTFGENALNNILKDLLV